MTALDGKRNLGGTAPNQRGVVLFVALIVLIVMTLAGLALLRQMSAGTSIAGNIAFKENATSGADRGVETARAWVMANAASFQDSFANGYHSSWETGVDPTAFPWDTQSRELTAAESDITLTGNRVRYIVHRLCQTADMGANDPAQRCSDSTGVNTGGSRGGISYGATTAAAAATPFYRITTRVDGPRNTVSYTQVLMN